MAQLSKEQLLEKLTKIELQQQSGNYCSDKREGDEDKKKINDWYSQSSVGK